MTTHNHRRSDYRHTYSPRRIQLLPVRRSLSCTPAIERRVREILTWHAGSCGLIADDAKDCIAGMYLDGTLTLLDFRKLASEKVYQECVAYRDEIIKIRKGKE